MARPEPPVDEGRGAPRAVLLHGFLGCAEDLSPLAAELGRTRRAVAIDLPGHGPAPPPVAGRGNPFFAAVDGLVARLEHMGLLRFDLVAYSMGGRVACGILAKYPERVRRAVLIGATPGIENGRLRRARAEADRRLAVRLEREPLPDFLDWWYGQRLFGTLKKHVSYPALLERRMSGEPAEMSRALVALSPGVQPPLWEDLARVAVPMLFMAGERDLKYARLVDEAEARLPSARGMCVRDASHAVHVEQPDVVARAIERFLDEPTS